MLKLKDRIPQAIAVTAFTLLAAGCDRESTAPLSTDVGGRSDVVTTASTYLIDTGPGGTIGTGAQSLFAEGSTGCSPQPACASNFQFLGGKFTLANEANVESVEGWMSVTIGGSVAVNIRPDSIPVTGPSRPKRTPIHSVSYAVAPQVFGWNVFSSFTVNLPAGTYWLTFEPVAGSQMNGSMNGTAAAPLADYAFWANGNAWYVPYSAFAQNPALGFRVFGTEVVPPPPPAVEGITNLETTIDGFDLPKGTEGSLDSKLNLALAALNGGNTPLACSYLQDAINFANAQSGKKLSVSQANTIISTVSSIRSQLGC